MKLNDELFEIGKNSIGTCKIIDNDYVLVTKKMPVSDELLEDYVNSIREAKEDGINICKIEDYKLLPETTSHFNNGTSFSKGVFIEERAKGNSLNFEPFYISEEDKIEIVKNYMNSIDFYISEIEKRSEASEYVYDKLVSDVLSLSKYGLEIDPKPLNFFFNEKTGYTIIDVIPITKLGKNEFIPQYIKSIVFGYGIPHLYLENNDISMMPKPLYDRYNNAKKILCAKIEMAMLKHDFKEIDFKAFDTLKNEKDPVIVDYVDLHDYVDDKIDEHKGYKI